MTRSPPPVPRAEATRTAIVETAERLFRSLGYQKTTVADIARELRMSPANVYRFFPSKAAINEAICARILDGFDRLAWSIARGPEPAPDRLRLLFRTMQRQTMTLFFHDKRMHDMVAAAMEEHWGVIRAYVESFDKALRHILMDGIAAGVFAPCDADRTSRLMHCTMIGFVHPTLVQEWIDDDLPGLAADMAELVLRSLRPEN
ncbi:TetR/AcrR family transcriptional regulator [Rhodovastum atsumiense]|nr:TetR/AcrR family transcriptional regulator [Rhodovastum atsumiense]CAH2599623.1 TetR/AcrR family transcriptional regulator [Rhodovastum atsumiense]